MNSKISVQRFVIALPTIFSILFGMVLHAAPILEEVIVTATKRAESVQSLALSVSALTGESLEDNVIFDFQEIDKLAPGVDFGASRDATSTTIQIRGIGEQSFGAATANSVAVLQDGFPFRTPGGLFGTIYDMERIEVLRGPQGTLFGRNAPVGVISVWTSKPNYDGMGLSVEGSYSSHNTYDVRGVINLPIIEDELAVRVATLTAESDGFIKNRFLDTDADKVDQASIRPAVLWTPGEKFDLWYSYTNTDHSDQVPSRLRVNAEYFSARPGIVNAFAAAGKPLPTSIDDFDTYEEAASESSLELEVHNLTMNWEFAGHTLSLLTTFNEGTSTFFDRRDGTPEALRALEIVSDTKTSSQELRVINHDTDVIEYLGGVFFYSDQIDATVDNLIPFAGISAQSLSDTSEETDSFGVFANAKYYFSDSVAVSLGLRYDSLDLTTDTDSAANFGIADSIDRGLVSLDDLEPTIEDLEQEFSNTSYSLKLSYTPNDYLLLYSGIDGAYREGGTNSALADSPNPEILSLVEYPSEQTDALEFGLKGDFLEDTLRFNLAAFYQRFDDSQVTRFNRDRQTNLYPTAAQAVAVVAGEVESKGIEIDGIWYMNAQWSLQYALTYYDVEATDFTKDLCRRGEAPGQVFCDHSGENLSEAPNLYSNLQLGYMGPLSNYGVDIFARLSATYRSDRNLFPQREVPGNDVAKDGYTVWDFSVGISSENAKWRLTAWGKNIFNEKYTAASGIQRTENGITWYDAAIVTPATYGITAKYYFGQGA